MKKNIKKIMLTGLVALLAIITFTACGDDTGDNNTEGAGDNTKVQVEMENGDTFVIELYPEYAPETVDNFVKLVKDGFFDGLTFHRIIDGFMAQGGGYDPSGAKKDSPSIKGEFSENGFTQNTLQHTKGVISMARNGFDMNSASSEFFIMFDYAYSAMGLDGKYAAFGQVIEGMDVVDKFQEIERELDSSGDMSSPTTPVVIKKVTMAN